MEMGNEEPIRQGPLLKMREECASSILVAGKRTSYCLCVIEHPRPRYLVAVYTDAETAVVDAGRKRSRATDFYQLILRGTVTPCTLGDIARDYFGSEEELP